MHAYLEQTWSEIETATVGLSVAQLVHTHQSTERSVVEILEHLTLYFATTSRQLWRCLHSEGAIASRRTLQQRLAMVVVVELGYIPHGSNAPSLPIREQTIAAEDTLERTRRALETMDGALTECEERFGALQRVAEHRELGSLTVNQWRRFHHVHARYHMKQVLALRRTCGVQASVTIDIRGPSDQGNSIQRGTNDGRKA